MNAQRQPSQSISARLPVASADGHTADLLVFPASRPGPGLLWIPALGVPARKYAPFAQALSERGVSVALHEWRGADSSSWRAGRHCDWGYRELLADILASRTALNGAADATGWAIGGHSLGAQIAALAMAIHPDVYTAYVIAGSGQPWWRTFPAWQQPLLFAVFGWFRGLSALCGYFPGDRVGFGGREARSVIRDWARSGISGSYRPDNVPVDFTRSLAALEHRALALRFVQDTYVPSRSLDHLLALMPRTRVDRHEIGPEEFERRRAGHFDWMRDPSPVTRRIAEWL
ncbi:alpha/beta hydrolase family protein [Tahibacter amnicola]|uniref:Alpha/beta hydrolase n=1 Tax=Tahibacter amnicola TaxID=2976241 RepID=A0ABY6B9H4_9GAMM|nr:alpha/beta fold hydrolase [Tahibacter amnicola]UXI66711.1 alpha/beta hydrolase [Tahibacter amnicola]